MASLDLGDVIITFNWDTIIERELRRQGKPIAFTERDHRAVTVLKLHGSLSWVNVPPDVEPKDPLMEKLHGDADARVFARTDFSYVPPWDALDKAPLVVPPVAIKQPVRAAPLLSRLWGEASIAIHETERVTIIGYSCPPEDLQARAVLSTMIRSREHSAIPSQDAHYDVVDPDPSVGARYYSQISPSLRFYQAPFSERLLPDLLGPRPEK